MAKTLKRRYSQKAATVLLRRAMRLNLDGDMTLQNCGLYVVRVWDLPGNFIKLPSNFGQ